MGFPFTINGNTYTASMFTPYGYVTAFPNLMSDLAVAIPAVQAVAANLTARERLTNSSRVYYVAASGGSNSNSGLTAILPFATIQKAWDTIRDNLDLNGFSVTIQLADGTYTAGLNAVGMPPGWIDGNRISLVGNLTTPANVIISVASGDAISIGNSAFSSIGLTVDGIELRAAASNGVAIYNGAGVRIGLKMRFGTCLLAHMYCHTGGYIDNNSTGYAVVGSAAQHILADMNAVVILHGITVVFSNSPTFSSFVVSRGSSFVAVDGNTWTNGGTVTGQRFAAQSGGIIVTGATSLTYLPGDQAGEETTGGYYSGPATGLGCELLEATLAGGSAVSVTDNTQFNVTQKAITAGTWEIYGAIVYVPAATTTVKELNSSLSETSATLAQTDPDYFTQSNLTSAGITLGGSYTQKIGPLRKTFTATTTVYLVGYARFGTSTMTAWGKIRAVRLRG